MVLYCSAQPLPVLSLGLSVPPARIEPVLSVISTFCRQAGCSGSLLPPLQLPLPGSLAAFSLPMTIWSIWPTFSASVIRRSRLSTRAETEAVASWSGAAVLPWLASGWLPSTSTDRIVAAAAMRRHLPVRSVLGPAIPVPLRSATDKGAKQPDIGRSRRQHLKATWPSPRVSVNAVNAAGVTPAAFTPSASGRGRDDPVEWRHRDPGRLGGGERGRQGVDVLGAAEGVAALVEHREPVAAGGEEVVHRHPERVGRGHLHPVDEHPADACRAGRGRRVLLVPEGLGDLQGPLHGLAAAAGELLLEEAADHVPGHRLGDQAVAERLHGERLAVG